MTNIKINRLRLENFKCHTLLELTPQGSSMAVLGDNAAGKTSVYDALTWLLFGKDSLGNGEKNMDIKPLNAAGEIADHSAITAVEATLSVGLDTVTLRRTYREVWATKRGQSQESFEGNTSEYYIDGVPCKKAVFDERIGQLVPEDIFKLLTSVSFFASVMPWQKRREVLFEMAGTVSDAQILAGAPQFAALQEGMGKLSLEDYKKKLLSEKKGFTGTKTDIPARISECQKTVEDLSELDFAGAKAENDVLEGRKALLTQQIADIENDSAARGKQLEIREVKVELERLETENNAFRAQQAASTPDIRSLNAAMTRQKAGLANIQSLLHAAEQSIQSYEDLIAESRSRWIAVNAESFTGGTCPTCGQTLPMEQLRKATESFEQGKQARLREIERTAESQKSFLAQTQTRIEQLQQEKAAAEEQVRAAEDAVAAAQSTVTVVEDMADYAQKKQTILGKISLLEDQLQTILENGQAAKEELQDQLLSVNAKIRENMAICGKESALTYAQQRIEQLREEGRNAAACLEAIEKMLFLIEEYVRYKTRVVEDSVNSLFRIARFRLFREQANGGVEDRCDVVVDGVPYSSLNNGMKINVGIDVINALSRHYGVTVPLFVDNAESVTNLEKADTQVIRLVVSADDKKLRCEYED